MIYKTKILFVGLVFLALSCQNQNTNGKLIAKVGKYELFEHQLNTLGQELLSDSIQKHLYIDKWVKEKTLFIASDNKVENKKHIDQMVDDYRHSLVVHQFENEYISANLQSEVEEAEINTYYDTHFATEKTGDKYIQVMIAKIPSNDPGVSNFKEYWNDNNFEEMQRFCTDHQHLCLLDSEIWHLQQDIEVLLPEPIHKALGKGKNLIQKNEKFQYFVKTKAVKQEGASISIDEVRENIIDRILFSRKRQLLINLHDSIYEHAIETNQIKLNL